MENEKVKETQKCRHCGGPMRDYRGGINCLMCGRSDEHSCERCKYAEVDDRYGLKRKVA
jgi:hypothetical protein